MMEIFYPVISIFQSIESDHVSLLQKHQLQDIGLMFKLFYHYYHLDELPCYSIQRQSGMLLQNQRYFDLCLVFREFNYVFE